MTVAILDYGMGNLHSVAKAFERIGLAVVVSDNTAELDAADALVLPGVGAFGDAMKELRSRGLDGLASDRAREACDGGRPFLGICLGMQILMEEGDEAPGEKGLSVFPGTCPRLAPVGLKVPHMGWNRLHVADPADPLYSGIAPSPHFYFVHGYHVVPTDKRLISSTVEYGGEVVAGIRRGNLHATQFHPEKSQEAGLKLLANFGALAAARR